MTKFDLGAKKFIEAKPTHRNGEYKIYLPTLMLRTEIIQGEDRNKLELGACDRIIGSIDMIMKRLTEARVHFQREKKKLEKKENLQIDLFG